MSSKETNEERECPVCERKFPANIIEIHVNKCIFLNTTAEELPPKRKRTPSPSLLTKPSNSHSNNNKQNRVTPSEIKQSPAKKVKTAPSPSLLTKPSKSHSNNNKQNIVTLSEIKQSPAKKMKTNTQDFTFITPLAKQVQPTCLSEFVGQEHVFGQNSILRTLFERGEIPNMILWGPPGCGKTSLAGVINGMCKEAPTEWKFVNLCAATAGVKDVQSVVKIAKNELKFGRRTILFMDEIHRFNKRQQDTFLLNVEKGDIVLIGATTENPSFTINNALLSRCRVIVFEKLETEALVAILMRATEKLNIEVIEDDNPHKYDASKPVTKLSIEKTALTWLSDISDGDARIALTNLQLAFQHHYNTNEPHVITVDDIKDEIKKSHMLYDRKGEEHYNLISALHKSIRGSDPSASLYWLARILAGGEDPLYVARRLVRAASEDVGAAEPGALPLAVAAMQGCQLLGAPECDVLLAQCALHLARAPKSREADEALAKAKRVVRECEGPQPAVPMHLRNAPTRLMKELGYGKHDLSKPLSFLPPGYEDVNFF